MSQPRLATLIAVAATVLASTGLVLAAPASATVPHPAAPAGLTRTIEPLADYVEQVSCDPHLRSGTAKLARLLAATYTSYSATSWASTYDCGTDGNHSEHYDGRAIDWMVDVHNPRQFAAAKATIAWLLATDAAGNRFAMARRLGVMYLIYNNRMWGSWDGTWQPYNNCANLPGRADDNACHRTHMHISLSWNGATGRTSFWTNRVYLTDFGPCRAADLNWAFLYTRVNPQACPQYPQVQAKGTASATKKALVTYSGAAVRGGWGGPAVSAVQRALHVTVTGVFGPATVSAVRHFQATHSGCPITGAMNQSTWRALLAVTR
ncbi:MAG TPA: peptidoglycan-binding domain-containing protein [Jatrophihabitans sp.]|nr:peptidoglycan-binding domain-containing protein [Jatrophihabitans sp.]